ncbi:PID-CTERM protein-sorting domain-containing protein [Pseudotamlana carrageenivorans]|uniref:Uncharacterized protein n=1 Tax=Pseudotamlana carrageenivorans TaxID=2069432 RepID=A0A2I7SHL2_9FLAO|nr:hypothetical protein [Tamlana carrageenivorans]AUS05387.1 hypothetical protein C1A40_07820 [Tamlana carrageenivorans]
MKNKKKSVFGLINVFAIVLVFFISSKTHASTTVSSSFSEADLSVLSLKIYTILLTTVVGDRNNDLWSKRQPQDSEKSNRFDKRRKPKNEDNDKKGRKNRRNPHDCDPDSTPSVPIDGGLSLLALGAIALGIKKIHKEKNNKI